MFLHTDFNVLKAMDAAISFAKQNGEIPRQFDLTEREIQQVELQLAGRVWAPTYRPAKMEYRGVPVIVKG